MDPGIFLSDMVFSQTGQQIIGQAGGGSVWVWDVASGKLIANPIDQQQALAFMALSPAGSWAAYTGINGITNVYNAATGAPITTNNGQAYPGGITGILMSPDETTLTIQGFNSVLKMQVQQWDIINGKYKIGLLNVPPQMTAWKYSTDGKRLYGINTQRLTAEPSTVLMVWNTTNGDLLKVFPKNDLIYDYLPSPDGKSILIATKDGVSNCSIPGPVLSSEVFQSMAPRSTIWRLLLTGKRWYPST
ncbi:MAG: WD40 repeat domain-containing protein [Anaerolineaceae bacterium]